LGARPAAGGVITKDYALIRAISFARRKSFAIMTVRRYVDVIRVHRDKGGMRPLAFCCAQAAQRVWCLSLRLSLKFACASSFVAVGESLRYGSEADPFLLQADRRTEDA
jgi:hypothetical protein